MTANVSPEQQEDFHFAIGFGEGLRQSIPVDVEVCDSTGARLK